MHAKTLALLSAVLLLAAPACSPGESGTNETSTSEVGTSTGDASTGSTGDTPTTGTPTTSGDSDSLSGTTADVTGSTTDVGSSSSGGESTVGESTGGESTGAESTGAESTGEPAAPVSFDECRMGDAAMCPAEDPACLVVDGPGGFEPNGSFFVTWSYCTRECEVDEDCVSAVQGGTAAPRCVPKGPNMVKVCVLDCSFGKTCPGELECSYDDACATRFCECEGTGCQDKLCTGE